MLMYLYRYDTKRDVCFARRANLNLRLRGVAGHLIYFGSDGAYDFLSIGFLTAPPLRRRSTSPIFSFTFLPYFESHGDASTNVPVTAGQAKIWHSRKHDNVECSVKAPRMLRDYNDLFFFPSSQEEIKHFSVW